MLAVNKFGMVFGAALLISHVLWHDRYPLSWCLVCRLTGRPA